MNVAVIGANGQLGHDICEVYEDFGHTIIGFNHDQIEVANYQVCHDLLKGAAPDLVINTAAMHHVEQCENNPEKAFRVNGMGARNLALLANDLNFTLCQISTDYVFDGTKNLPYVETDCPLPLNVYGNTKLSGEIFVRTIAPRYFVARVSGLYGVSPCRAKGGLNFVRLMLKLAKERDEIRVVADEVLTPTHTRDIAGQLARLTETNNYGCYHMSCQGSCSWYQFAEKIFELADIKVKLSLASPGEFPAKVPRPKYSVLENRGLKNLGLDIMPHWTESLQEYLKQSHF